MSARRKKGKGAYKKYRTRAGPGYQRTEGFYGRFGAGGELKFWDLDVDDAVVAAAGTIAADSVNLIPQGVTESTRVGRMCRIRKIQARFQVSLPTTSVPGDTAEGVRIIVYHDKQANGAAATVAGILEAADWQAFNNLSTSKRFVTLFDKRISLRSMSGSYDGTNDQFGADLQMCEFYKNVNIPVEFASTTGAITEIQSSNVGVLYISAAGLAAIQSKFRIRFSDS